MKEKKTLLNSSLIAAAAINFTPANAETIAQGPEYESIKRALREYVQQIVQEECSGVEGYDFDAFEWEEYEVLGLEVILADILHNTQNYCKPPELTGMHSAKQNQGDAAVKPATN